MSNAEDKEPAEVDPMDFLASLLRLTPEDAERVRNATPEPDDTDRDRRRNRHKGED